MSKEQEILDRLIGIEKNIEIITKMLEKITQYFQCEKYKEERSLSKEEIKKGTTYFER